MALKAILDSLDGLSEELKKEYKKNEQDGKFWLDVTSVGTVNLEDVGGLKTVLADQKEKLKTAKAKLDLFGELDPEDVKEKLAEFEKLKKTPPKGDVEERVKDALKQVQEKFDKEKSTLTEERDSLHVQLRGALITGEATRAIAAKKGNVKLLLPHVEAHAAIEKGEDGRFRAVVVDESRKQRISMKQGNTGPMGIDELVEEMAGKDDFAPAFAGSGATGSGATGGGRTPPGNNNYEGLYGADKIREFRKRQAASGK